MVFSQRNKAESAQFTDVESFDNGESELDGSEEVARTTVTFFEFMDQSVKRIVDFWRYPLEQKCRIKSKSRQI